VGIDEAKTTSFESALTRLEEIVAILERGEVTLEEALELFEDGARLRDLCADRLQAAASRMESLAGPTDEDKA